METIPTHFDLLVRLRYVKLRVEAPPKIHHLGNLHVNVWLHVSCDCMPRKGDGWQRHVGGWKRWVQHLENQGETIPPFGPIRNVQLYILNLHFIKTNFLFPGSSGLKTWPPFRESNGHKWKKLVEETSDLFTLYIVMGFIGQTDTCSMIIGKGVFFNKRRPKERLSFMDQAASASKNPNGFPKHGWRAW